MRRNSSHASQHSAFHLDFAQIMKVALIPVQALTRTFSARQASSAVDNQVMLPPAGAPQSTAEHLERARGLLAKRNVWTQDAYARDAAGRIVESQSPDAVRFCCSGAIYTTEHPLRGSVEARALVGRVIGHDLEVWNDMPGRKYKDVLDAFDGAIALAKSQED